MKYKIITFGCKVNTYESEIMMELLNASGYINDEINPDIIIINTCSVTNNADSKCRKTIHHERKEFPNSYLIVCGCSAENHKEDLNNLSIDLLIGNKDKSKIVSLIEEHKGTKYTKFYDNKKLEFEDMTVSRFKSHTRAFLKVQDGCNNYCAYCIIPYLRGNIRSKNFDKAICEASKLVENGHKEIVLTGIHTGSYGFNTDHDLTDLINEMSKISDLERIRISSIEITELNDKFMEMLANNKKVCNHLHIPLQAGSNHILKLMNRKYDLNYYEKTINKIRSIRPDISITTDIIVGFPDETDADFKSTMDFSKKIKFAKIHVFPYSKRNGTKAALMTNQVNGVVKKERAHKLLELSSILEEEYYNKFIGCELEVIIEENIDGYSIGHTSNYLKLKIKGNIKSNTTMLAKIISYEDKCSLASSVKSKEKI